MANLRLEMLRLLQDVETRIKAGEIANGIALLNGFYQTYEKFRHAIEIFEKMEILGMLAHGYRMAGAILKEIQILEELCPIALLDLERLGLMASSEDIRLTSFDLLYLGLAYLNVNKKSEARETLTKAEKLFTEIGWEVDAEAILEKKIDKVILAPKKPG